MMGRTFYQRFRMNSENEGSPNSTFIAISCPQEHGCEQFDVYNYGNTPVVARIPGVAEKPIFSNTRDLAVRDTRGCFFGIT